MNFYCLILTLHVGIAVAVATPFVLTFILSLTICVVSILVFGLYYRLDRRNKGITISQVARLSLLDIRQDVQNSLPFDDWAACKIITNGFWYCFFSHKASNRNKFNYCKRVLCYCTSKTRLFLYETSKLWATVIVMLIYGTQSIVALCNKSTNKINGRQISINSDTWYNKWMKVCEQEANDALLKMLNI